MRVLDRSELGLASGGDQITEVASITVTANRYNGWGGSGFGGWEGYSYSDWDTDGSDPSEVNYWEGVTVVSDEQFAQIIAAAAAETWVAGHVNVNITPTTAQQAQIDHIKAELKEIYANVFLNAANNPNLSVSNGHGGWISVSDMLTKLDNLNIQITDSLPSGVSAETGHDPSGIDPSNMYIGLDTMAQQFSGSSDTGVDTMLLHELGHLFNSDYEDLMEDTYLGSNPGATHTDFMNDNQWWMEGLATTEGETLANLYGMSFDANLIPVIPHP